MKLQELAKQLKSRSRRAVCGAFEREVNVKPENLQKSVKALRESGQQIVGTGDRKRTIWFIQPGLAGL